MKLDSNFENRFMYLANYYPYAWNNYIICNQDTNIIVYKNGIHFSMDVLSSNSYMNLIYRGIMDCLENTNQFIHFLNTN